MNNVEVSQEAREAEVTQALKYSRMADPEAWENADVGKHSRENNIRLARANAMGKARYLSELFSGFSQSQFVEAAASENGENLLNALVGVLSDYPNHRQSAERGEVDRLRSELNKARGILERLRDFDGWQGTFHARHAYDAKQEAIAYLKGAS